MTIHRVKLAKDVLPILVHAAIQGYETLPKQERLGILLGRINGEVAIVRHAVVYHGGSRSSAGVMVDRKRFTRRVRDLSREHNSLFLGTFHSHNEVSGRRSSALTIADRRPFSEDPPHLVELIVLVWHSNEAFGPSQRYLQGHLDGCRFRIAGYQMHSAFKLIPVGAADANKASVKHSRKVLPLPSGSMSAVSATL